jgi:myo-inositol-hexaphosphate 3-phosphohydrolase
VRVPRAIQAASAVVPYAARRQLSPQGNFDYFGTQNAQKANDAIESVQNEDLADVVGEEALAAHRMGAVQNQAVGKVIDLTAHDETEQIDLARLRGAVS